MFANIKLLNGFQQSLTYSVPQELHKYCVVGTIVRIPLQKRIETGIIHEIVEELPQNTRFKIRAIISVEQFPSDIFHHKFVQELANYYCIDQIKIYQRIKQFLKQNEQEAEPVSEVQIASSNVELTDEQNFIVKSLEKNITDPKFAPALIHGITGSGKTEIYKKLIIKCVEQQKAAILLLPEVSLAVQFSSLLSKQLGENFPIYNFHSATSKKEKNELWNLLNQNKPCLIIGVHLPILLPISKLGLIIVDEEHEMGYQEKKHPKINTKEAAIFRARIYNIPIILGSATPSISTLYNIKNKNWQMFQLKKRFGGNLPEINVVNLQDKKKRKNFWISSELENGIKACLEKKEQAIIFLNRRGFSFFVQCKSCSFVFSCTQCSVSLTLHDNKKLICHYCGYNEIISEVCKSCKSTNLLKKGLGTQQVVSILEKIFPSVCIARADLDTTIDRKKWQATIKDFESGKIDILVGTQTITKGYNFPKATLVGVIWADINLNLPIYNSAEFTLAQLIQVAGRAGRFTQSSKVIIQTINDNEIFRYLNELDYINFYNYELEKRELVNYPPITRLVEIELKNKDENIIENETTKIFRYLKATIEKNKLNVSLLGPALPPVYKIKNVHSRKIFLKCKNMEVLKSLYSSINFSDFSSSIFYTPNPLN